MTDRFTQLVRSVDDVEVGDDVLLKVRSSLPGLSGEIVRRVTGKETIKGKRYLVLEKWGAVKVPAGGGEPTFKVYRAPAAEGGRRKTRRGHKSRSTRRRRA